MADVKLQIEASQTCDLPHGDILSLPLLVLGIGTPYMDHSLAAHHLALVAEFSH